MTAGRSPPLSKTASKQNPILPIPGFIRKGQACPENDDAGKMKFVNYIDQVLKFDYYRDLLKMIKRIKK